MIQGTFFDAGSILYKRTETPRNFAIHLLGEPGAGTELVTQDEARLRILKERASNGF